MISQSNGTHSMKFRIRNSMNMDPSAHCSSFGLAIFVSQPFLNSSFSLVFLPSNSALDGPLSSQSEENPVPMMNINPEAWSISAWRTWILTITLKTLFQVLGRHRIGSIYGTAILGQTIPYDPFQASLQFQSSRCELGVSMVFNVPIQPLNILTKLFLRMVQSCWGLTRPIWLRDGFSP
jgi:hypothetical protein